MSYTKEKTWALFLVVVLFALGSRYSQGQSDEELAKATQNPVGDLISVPLQNNTNFYAGPEKGTQNVLNIQPVWPISISDNWNLITRTIFPMVSLPEFTAGGDRTNGMADVVFTAFISPKKASKLIWGVGPALLFPTATDDILATDKWGAGPSVVVLTMQGPWVAGSLFNNVWSFAGSGANDINLFTWQYFINYNFPGGSYFISAPIITSNWEADSGDKWTIPFGGGIGQIFRIGQLPINLNVQAYYNVKKPEFAGSWQVRIQWAFLFPKG